MQPRVFTVEEANATLPKVRELLGPLREAVHENRFLQEQLEDLRRMYGPDLASPACAGHDDHAKFLGMHADAESRIRAIELEFQALGVEVKDPVLGLVDFYGRRGPDLVYLCWKEGEDRVAHWHPLVGGFAARKPL